MWFVGLVVWCVVVCGCWLLFVGWLCGLCCVLLYVVVVFLWLVVLVFGFGFGGGVVGVFLVCDWWLFGLCGCCCGLVCLWCGLVGFLVVLWCFVCGFCFGVLVWFVWVGFVLFVVFCVLCFLCVFFGVVFLGCCGCFLVLVCWLWVLMKLVDIVLN